MPSSAIDPEHLRGLIGDDRDKIGRYLQMFLDGARQTITEVAEAMARGDLAEVRRAAHKLKGSSGMVGAKRLATVAAELERAAAAGSVPDGSAFLRRLETEFAAAVRYVAEQTA